MFSLCVTVVMCFFLQIFGRKYREGGERASEEKVSVEVGVFRCRCIDS